MSTSCSICGKKNEFKFEAILIRKYKARFFYCKNCGFLQTCEPFWLSEAYQQTINKSDTGILARNILMSKVSSIIIFFLFKLDGKFLDFAGGYGIFTRLMRDKGFDFYWHDPYTENLFAKGFEYSKKTSISLITCFESFEHFNDPWQEINKILTVSRNVLFTTTILPLDIPLPDSWEYYGLEHGQHISFYSLKTLKYIADKKGLYINSYLNIHLISEKKINRFIYKLLIIFALIGLDSLVKIKLKSKTLLDRDRIIKKDFPQNV